jgi:phenylalanyl-tRNA synthetase beta chain
MKFTLSWLKDFLDTNAEVSDISSTLTQIGLEVESVSDKREILKDFIVGHVISATEHPNANKLKVCVVDIGKETLQIVCGGVNARENIKVVVAVIGTTIPGNGLVIKPTTIRDVASNGMLVSMDELNLGESNGEIIELPEHAILGDEFAKYLGLDDVVFEIAITPNRGDWLGVYGIAKDLAAAGVGTFKAPQISKIAGDFKSPIKVTTDINDTKIIGRYIKNVDNTGKTPALIAKRLNAIGETLYSPLVDITNYILFTFARPLHVYDADTLDAELSFTKAAEGLVFTALNDKEYKTKGNEIIATSGKEIAGFAGIIGSTSTGTYASTKNIFLEVASFNKLDIAAAGRKHHIDTDARYRFERYVDPLFLDDAMSIATQMILEFCGGTPSFAEECGVLDYTPIDIEFDTNIIEKLSGLKIADEVIETILKNLGFSITHKQNNILKLAVPSSRGDISISEDIVEEILRIYGYDKIPLTPMPLESSISANILNRSQNNKIIAKRILANIGYYEVVTWSFMSSKDASLFGPLIPDLKLANPISQELDYMRPSILSNFLHALKKNIARSISNLALFEVGKIFKSPLPQDQHVVISGIRHGMVQSRNMYEKERKVDFFDIKGDVFIVLENCGFDTSKLNLNADKLPSYFHPGKSAAILLGNKLIGYVGSIHPLILNEYKLEDEVLFFELFTKEFLEPKKKRGKKNYIIISDYPSVERDFAFIVDKNLKVAEITRIIAAADKELIKNVNIFDIYSGKNIEEHKKSVAVSVTIQSDAKTLTDAEIEILSKNIISNIENKLQGKLRS